MFKRGDIITGKPNSKKKYRITNENAIMKVVTIETHCIRVKVLSSADIRGHIGGIFTISPLYFELYNGANTVNKTAVERKITVMYKRFESRNAK